MFNLVLYIVNKLYCCILDINVTCYYKHEITINAIEWWIRTSCWCAYTLQIESCLALIKVVVMTFKWWQWHMSCVWWKLLFTCGRYIQINVDVTWLQSSQLSGVRHHFKSQNTDRASSKPLSSPIKTSLLLVVVIGKTLLLQCSSTRHDTIDYPNSKLSFWQVMAVPIGEQHFQTRHVQHTLFSFLLLSHGTVFIPFQTKRICPKPCYQ